ncbi:hypothetical protein [Geothrix campi]|jgi:hypothetical protein|uniref:hypothetical protein n=1 Tax=Geothrix campi TaxID=2966450 RepID=UPI002148032C|nr:hypothetical protein [Geothrix sp. SG10]
MNRRTSQSPLNYDREAGTERRAMRSRGDRRRHSRALRLFFIPLGLLVHKLRTRSLAF